MTTAIYGILVAIICYLLLVLIQMRRDSKSKKKLSNYVNVLGSDARDGFVAYVETIIKFNRISNPTPEWEEANRVFTHRVSDSNKQSCAVFSQELACPCGDCAQQIVEMLSSSYKYKIKFDFYKKRVLPLVAKTYAELGYDDKGKLVIRMHIYYVDIEIDNILKVEDVK